MCGIISCVFTHTHGRADKFPIHRAVNTLTTHAIYVVAQSAAVSWPRWSDVAAVCVCMYYVRPSDERGRGEGVRLPSHWRAIFCDSARKRTDMPFYRAYSNKEK